MTTYRFGIGVDTGAYFEKTGTNPPLRPQAGDSLVLQVRNQADQTVLANTSIQVDTGYWSYTTVDIPVIEVSTNGTDWTPHLSIEGQIAGSNAGLTAAQALSAATAANVKAQQALDASAGSGPKFTLATGTVVGPKNAFTVGELHLRTTDVPLSINDFADLPLSSETGMGADLNDYASPNGVAPLGADGRVPASYMSGGGGGGTGQPVIRQNNDLNGTFPTRDTVSTDSSVSVLYDPWFKFDKRPPIGTDASTAYAMNPAGGIPGDEVVLYGPGS